MKRFFDIVLSFTGIILFFPIILIIIILKIIIDKQNPFFVQNRITKNIKAFKIIKIQTMNSTYDPLKKGVQVKGNSICITTLGRFLRITKLDELPQLWNILIGEMSFVGPRPELPRRLQYYSESDLKIWSLRAGITSPASLVFINEELIMNKVDDPENHYINCILPLKIKLNQYYASNQSFLYDIKLVIFTFFKIFKLIDLNQIIRDENLRKDINSYNNIIKKFK